jgi:hypothetical protein
MWQNLLSLSQSRMVPAVMVTKGEGDGKRAKHDMTSQARPVISPHAPSAGFSSVVPRPLSLVLCV